MTQRIKTNLKFYQGLGNAESRLYALVTKLNGSWRGCRESDQCKKKIVFPDAALAQSILPNVLYCCSLAPMKSGDGFVAVSASVVQFKGLVETAYGMGRYTVSVKFGNKTVTYDPESGDRRKRDIQAIAGMLRTRPDLLDAQGVAEDFISSACLVKRLYEQDKAGRR